MKCPECGYISFDDSYLCTKCGKIIDAAKLQNDFIQQITVPADPAAQDLPRPKNLEKTISSLKEDLALISRPQAALKPAKALSRIMAYGIDWTIISVFSAFLLFNVFVMLNILSNSQLNVYQTLNSIFIPFYFFSFLIKCFYFVFFHAATGQTFGKLLCGIKVCDINGKNITVFKSFVRFLGYYLCFYSLFLGFFWILFNRKRQGWHDCLAKTLVVTKTS